MCLHLLVSLGNGPLVFLEQRKTLEEALEVFHNVENKKHTYSCVLEPIPVAKVIIQCIMPGTRPSGLRGACKGIVATPYTLWTLAVAQPHSFSVVEGILFVILVLVGRLVKFGNKGPDMKASSWTQLLGPRIHACKDVDEPLAGNVVADGDNQQLHCPDGRREDVVHVGVSKGWISTKWDLKGQRRTHLSPLCKFPIPLGSIISDLPHIVPPTPV